MSQMNIPQHEWDEYKDQTAVCSRYLNKSEIILGQDDKSHKFLQ